MKVLLLVAVTCGLIAGDVIDEGWSEDLASWIISILGGMCAYRLMQQRRGVLAALCLVAAVAHNKIRPIDFYGGDEPWVYGWTSVFAVFLMLVHSGKIKGGPLPSIYPRAR